LGHVACMEEMRNVDSISVEKLEGKKLVREPRCRWDDSIRIDHKEIGWEGVDWIHLAQEG